MRQRMVRDVMTRGVVTVPVDAPLRDVVTTMADFRVSSVVVVWSDGSVAGVIAGMDILTAFERAMLEKATAEDIMTPHIEGVSPTATLDEAARIMGKKRIHRLFVLSERVGGGTRAIGTLSSTDVIKELARSMRTSNVVPP
ncbi:MAG: CBS domain-containing protein [Methermicoccaceae archaeon]